MWCGLPMTITRNGYSKVIEQLKAKLEKRNEERNMLLKLQEGKLSSIFRLNSEEVIFLLWKYFGTRIGILIFSRYIIEIIRNISFLFYNLHFLMRASSEQLENINTIDSLKQKLKQKEEKIGSMTRTVGGTCYLVQEKMCGTCCETIDNENHRPMVFFPCGHARYCESCYGKLPNPKKCPDCRIKIQKAAILYN